MTRRYIVLALTAVTALSAAGCADLGAPAEPVIVTETVATVTGAPLQGGVGAAPGEQSSPSGLPVLPPGHQGPGTPGEPAGIPEHGGAVDLNGVVNLVQGPAGVAVAPVGDPGEVASAGAWQSGVAWSTIKVPLAVAVERSNPQVLTNSASAITVSDNQAAEALWLSLGGGQASASAVMAVLAEGDDPVSQVPAVHTRAGYSIFGQTQWSLGDQTRFASALPCLNGASRVVELMGQISPSQQWGLGRIPGARFKGGWGPGESGGYLVRQFGIVPGAGGDIAVALAVQAPTFEAGTAALSTLADGLAPQLSTMPGGSC